MEGETHSLIVEDGGGLTLRVPRDGIDWLGAELNSIFIRDRIGGPRCVSGAPARRGVPGRPEAAGGVPRRPRRGRSPKHPARSFQLGGLARDSSREQREALKSIFYTHDLICDPEAYAQLSQGYVGEGFFPAYRAPRS
ncbi:hypothetical protein [Corallococcus sp. RDP092CA]|uniref:hypothetical protein n=1 Tax=Corallococcus sp. RDP092CA TaxID=3109369 RepID=UPI0035B16D80